MSEPDVSWRSELLSDAHGLIAISVANGRVEDANTAARELFGGACVGEGLEALFGRGGEMRVSELASRGVTSMVELPVNAADGAARSFLLVSLPSGALLVTPRLARPSARSPAERPSGVIEAAQAAATSVGVPEPSSRVLVADAFAELPPGDVTTLLHTIALEAQAMVEADYVALGIGGDPTRPFDPWVSVGMSVETMHAIGRRPRPVGLLGVVAREGEVVRVADFRTDSRTRGLPPNHPPMTSFLGVPIRLRGHAVGNIYLANKPGRRAFTEADERTVRTLAASAGVAIETALLYVAEKRQRSWLRNVIDQMPSCVLLYDESGKLVASNHACETLCGSTPCTDKFGNLLVLDIRGPDGNRLASEDLPMVRAFETHEPTFRQEAYLHLRDGRAMPVSMSAVPVRDPVGKVTGVATVIEDISEHKGLERMREEWAAIVAHDLRQPVGVISLAADLLLKLHAADWSDRDRKIIDRIRSASTHLARMISDLTDASLIETRRLAIEPQRVDLRLLLHSVVESLDALAAGYEVRVNVQGEHEAWVDPDRIRQVLGNLVSNAVKYGRPGSAICIDVLGDGDDEVELVVTNHGRGIPPDQLSRVFGRFERARGARESRTAGLGLGLHIAKGIVEAHGGCIWVESIPEQTTSFHVRLPRRRNAGRAEAAESSEPEADVGGTRNAESGQVLPPDRGRT